MEKLQDQTHVNYKIKTAILLIKLSDGTLKFKVLNLIYLYKSLNLLIRITKNI